MSCRKEASCRIDDAGISENFQAHPRLQPALGYEVVSPAYRAALTASLDDEPVTAGDARAIAIAREDLRDGRVGSHEEILDEFGLR